MSDALTRIPIRSSRWPCERLFRYRKYLRSKTPKLLASPSRACCRRLSVGYELSLMSHQALEQTMVTVVIEAKDSLGCCKWQFGSGPIREKDVTEFLSESRKWHFKPRKYVFCEQATGTPVGIVYFSLACGPAFSGVESLSFRGIVSELSISSRSSRPAKPTSRK